MASRSMKRRPETRNKRRYVALLYILGIFVACVFAGALGIFALCQTWLYELPDYEDASAYNLAEKTKVYASDGTTLLAELYLENREPVDSLDEISQYVLDATIATEDQRFYEHGGIDVMGIARALVVDLTGGSREGASTITQQFVRNTVLADEASESTLKRKVREAYISIKLEEIYSKDEILLMYLNTINYGSGAYGIEAASQRYFSKSCSDLTIAEAATLVGIPQSPTNNNPIDNPDACLERRNLVLNRMLTNGYITQAEYDQAVAEPLVLNTTDNSDLNGIYQYPYFSTYVRDWLLDNYSESEVFKGGMTVITTLDVYAQECADAAAQRKEAAVDDDMEVALVAIDPDTGYIRAMVGGKDFYADQYNLATQATRSPGSTFKVYTLLAALEDGIDITTQQVDCSSRTTIGTWSLENYDGANYGIRTIQSALTVSSNTGFAHLVTLLGADKVAEMAERCGVQTDLLAVPSITLGGDDVTVLDMAAGYSTIATGGIQRDPVCVQEIRDQDGTVIYTPDTTGTRVISEEVAKAAEQAMETVVTSGTGTAARLSTGQTAAGKTGTSENFYDSWFVGITPQYSVAIWLGTREQRSMSPSYTATSVFSWFLNAALADAEIESFPMAKASSPTYRTLTDEEIAILLPNGTASEEEEEEEEEEKEEEEEEESKETKESTTEGTTNGGTGNTAANNSSSTNNNSSSSSSGTTNNNSSSNSATGGTGNGNAASGTSGSSGTTGG